MIKKAVFFTGLFLFLCLVNVYLIEKAYSVEARQARIQRILAEIQNNNQKQFSISAAPDVLGVETGVGFADSRAANLKAFFRKYNSPLYDYADQIVQVSDKYRFDYRLLPAIAMQESNLCRVIPDNSYNCWGWGIYGNTITRFNSYGDAIDTIAKGISEQYIQKGLVTASMIMQKYTPSSNGSWAYGVNTFLKALE